MSARLPCLAAALGLAAASAAAGPTAALEAARPEIERLIRASGAFVAVAARTLDGGETLLIRPDEAFHAASTMKVPVMIELFARADQGGLRLDDPLPVRNQFASIVDGSPYSLDPAEDSDQEIYRALGSSLTLRQLCEAMITVSSNLATNLSSTSSGSRTFARASASSERRA